ncbi:WYL domain-containing protein [Haloferula sp. A504]|uniref:WYL domain-containing protein n=1 Tax=Haloferula sp. A504 TaxID=3373601 RepID=UPI0031C0E3F7|nr:WYL domain-containing protein [Verrucomicrobiaceae bacterium E54]
MNSLRHPGRRAFLGFLGALMGAPGAVRASIPTFADDRERWLREWADRPRIPVREAEDPLTDVLLKHSVEERPLSLFYFGGSHPGRLRQFSPDLVFRHERGHHTYVSGFCHLEEAPRILRLDRIGLA